MGSGFGRFRDVPARRAALAPLKFRAARPLNIYEVYAHVSMFLSDQTLFDT